MLLLSSPERRFSNVKSQSSLPVSPSQMLRRVMLPVVERLVPEVKVAAADTHAVADEVEVEVVEVGVDVDLVE